MAHRLDQHDVDQLAAAQAEELGETPATEKPVQTEALPTLGANAEGDSVTKLVNLLAVLGYTDNDVIKGNPPVLNSSVQADVRKAQTDLNITEAEGELVGPATWHALYEAAAAKIEGNDAPAAPAASTGAASA
jgi:peptidoglycan hydrolase-like protein with peptidoglycan-binding domain